VNEFELSRVLEQSLRLYGSEIAQLFKLPPALKPLVNGEDAIVVVHLNKDNTLKLTPYEQKAENTQLKPKLRRIEPRKLNVMRREKQ